jgi:hypothetical protein
MALYTVNCYIVNLRGAKISETPTKVISGEWDSTDEAIAAGIDDMTAEYPGKNITVEVVEA